MYPKCVFSLAFCCIHMSMVCVSFVSSANAEGRQLTQENVWALVNVVKQFQSNVESIRTWQGEAIVEEKSLPMPGLIPIDRKVNVKFWVDVPNGKRMFISEPIEEIQQTYEGKHLPTVYQIKGVLILNRDSTSYRRVAIMPKGDIPLPGENGTTEYVAGKDKDEYDPAVLRGRINVLPSLDLGANRYDVIADFDPFRVMDHLGASYIRRFTDFAGLAEEGKDTAGIFVDIRGTEVSLILRDEYGGQTVTNVFTMDSRFRGCPTEHHNVIPDVLDTRFTSEYENIQGLCVPKGVRMNTQGKTLTISFTKNILNEPIPEDVFSLKGLGAMRGDAVYDARTDTHYFLDEEQYPLPDYAKDIGRAGVVFWRYASMGVALLIIFAILVIRYYKWQQR